jgi:methylglutamate dehydrogenase subunit B
MRLICPLCGPRDRREFYYSGSDDLLHRPAAEDAAGWDDMLHLRVNPAGETRDLWYHESGCGSWLVVTRNTVTHEVIAAGRVADRKGGVA